MRYEQINLEDLRKKNPSLKPKPPFEHQKEAFKALSETFTFPADQYKGGLLVLPTGAGKTYTAVNWICRHIISKKFKVLWFAQSSYLLNQAAKSFYENALEIPPTRRNLNIRVVSGSPSNSPASSIDKTDDVLIITTQTAIINFNAKPEDESGNIIETKFKDFLKNGAKSGVFVVLDEAHHAPAYGFRHLWMNLRDMVPNLYILGLTATPTYTDKRTSGWLFKIFDKGIIYQVEQSKLIAQNILALPKYIQKPTGRDFDVDDGLYDRLVRDHKDLPEDIIQKLADDSARNNYIINEFAANKNDYGKTIIFADRVPQCIYLKTKLKDKGINVEAVYSDNEVRLASAEARNKRTSTENEKIISDFKNGKKYDVLVNVRMLTEGVDIPDVKTVFLTRQTTSSILMTQMLGRALRGKRAGGGNDKSEANIVLFIDNWKGLIDVWAHPDGEEDETPLVRGYRPIEYFSVSLIEQLARQIESGVNYFPCDFLEYVPVGWYQTDVTVSVKDDYNAAQEDIKEEVQTFTEFVMVYNKNKDKYDRFMKDMLDKIPEKWSDEALNERSIMPQIQVWINEYFDQDDDIGNLLMGNLIKISRHIAKNNVAPKFHSFEDRDKYDLDKIAKKFISKPPLEQHNLLIAEFEKPGSWWKLVFKDYYKFKTAFDAAINSIIFKGNITEPMTTVTDDIEITEEEKEQVKRRDNFTCQCCERNGKGTRLEIDHIVPVFLGGQADVENSQTLCKECNRQKGTNIVNFRINRTCLSKPKELILYPVQGGEYLECTFIRTVNFFYRCQAVSRLDTSKRSNGKNYFVWRLELYQGNNPDWLSEHKGKLIDYMHNEFGLDYIEDIEIVGINA